MLQYETPLPWCHGNFNGLAVFDLLSVHDLLRLRVVLTFYRLSIVSVKEGSSRRFVALLHGLEQMADPVLCQNSALLKDHGCNLMHRKVLASFYQHLMAEAPMRSV